MAKRKVKLSLSRRSVESKIELGRTVHDSMNLNPNFTSPNPTLIMLKSVTDALEAAFIARQTGSHVAVQQMYDAEVDFDAVMTALGAYVENIAQGSADIILSAGMPIRNLPVAIGIPAKVISLTAKPTDVLGSIRLRWKSVKGRMSYNVYRKVDGETDEQYLLVAQPTKADITFEGLDSATYYWFRVEAVGTAGTGAVSDGAKAIAF
jgi:hypothetical protein